MNPHITRILASALALGTTIATAADLYVAPDGSDTNPGTQAQPFATLEKARDAIRAIKKEGAPSKGAVTVWIGGGVYALDKPLEFQAEDSGTADAPVVYRSQPGQEVRVVGGRVVTGWKPVTDPAVLARMDAAARQKVVQADLRAQGITQFAPLMAGPDWSDSEPGMELFFAGKPTTLARWPNGGFTKIADFPSGATPYSSSRGAVPDSSAEGRFVYEGDRPARWATEKDVFLHGYWNFDWADQRLHVAKIDVAKHEITLDPQPVHDYGFVKGKSYYAYNLLPELDEPGEWYLDRDRGILYFWPPADVSIGKPTVSIVPTLAVLRDVSHLTLRGLTFEMCQETAIKINGGSDVTIAASVVRNTGGYAIDVASGKHHQVIGCDLYDLGDGGVILCGGDRAELIPAGHVVENCHIHHYSRWNPILKPGVILGRMGLGSARIPDVGSRVAHCLIDNAPHLGVWALGNDHVVEYNEFHSLVYQANDAEAFGYGFDWTYQGIVFRYNCVHDLYGLNGHGCKGVRIDNHSGGLLAYGNIFERIWVEPGRGAVTLHGGRNHTIANNLFIDCETAIRVHKCQSSTDEFRRLLARVPYQQSPWKERYPHLVNILDNEPDLPKDNTFANNVTVNTAIYSTDLIAASRTTATNNIAEKADRIARLPSGIPVLSEKSAAYKLGFQAIPAEKIGLYPDELRASWPVKTTVRPAPHREPPAPRKISKTARVRKAPAPIKIDGQVTPDEWQGAGIELKAFPSAPGDQPGAAGRLFLSYDADNLYVAVRVPLPAETRPLAGADWGKSDGAEVSVRDASRDAPGPTQVIRGFASGSMYVSPDAGLHPEDVSRLQPAVRFAAGTREGEWSAEWMLPFAAMEMVPQPGMKLDFNLAAWRGCDKQWLLWAYTGGAAWLLEKGSSLVLE